MTPNKQRTPAARLFWLAFGEYMQRLTAHENARIDLLVQKEKFRLLRLFEGAVNPATGKLISSEVDDESSVISRCYNELNRTEKEANEAKETVRLAIHVLSGEEP